MGINRDKRWTREKQLKIDDSLVKKFLFIHIITCKEKFKQIQLVVKKKKWISNARDVSRLF